MRAVIFLTCCIKKRSRKRSKGKRSKGEGAAAERATHVAATLIGLVVMLRAKAAAMALWVRLGSRFVAPLARRKALRRIEQPTRRQRSLAKADERRQGVHHAPAVHGHAAHA